MAFNSNTYHAGKWRRKAAADLAEARAMKARIAAGTAVVTDAPERVAMFAKLAVGSARIARTYEALRALEKGNG